MACTDFEKLFDVLQNSRTNNLSEDIRLVLATITGGFGIGSIIGLGHIRKWRSLLICGATGTIVGVLIAATIAAPAKPNQVIAAGLLPLLTTLIVRFRTP